MLKKVRSAVSAVLTAVIVCTSVLSASASSATREDYESVNADQKEYYTQTYVPCYENYLQTLRNFREQIHNTDFETKEQAQRVLNFLKDLKARHEDFYGTRETAGKSRYDVPAAREAMYKAADEDQDYDAAIQYCHTLKALVEARVDFLNGIINEVSSFEIIAATPATTETAAPTTITTTTAAAPTETAVTTETTATATAPAANAAVEFHADQTWDEGSFGFYFVLYNNTDADISNWTLNFQVKSAHVNSIWRDGCGLNVEQHGNTVSLSPQDQYQNGYTIPAHGSVTFRGRANGNARNATFSNAFLDGEGIGVSYSLY